MAAPRKATQVRAALEAKGMTPTNNHHVMFRKEIDGVTTLITRISHGMDEIGDSLGKRMANQCALQLKEFWELIDCTLSAKQWDDLVRARCAGGHNPFLGGR